MQAPPVRLSDHGVLVRRTAYGIPHILASDYRGPGMGAGYAFAEVNACLLADAVVTLSAQRSRWFGAGGNTVNLGGGGEQPRQRSVPPVGQPDRRGATAAGTTPSAGYNRYLAESEVAHLPDAACRGAAWVHPITGLDLWRRTYDMSAQASETLTLVPGNPRAYLVDGRVQPIRQEQATVTVRGPEGALTPAHEALYNTPDGPLLSFPGLRRTTPSAVSGSVTGSCGSVPCRSISTVMARSRPACCGAWHEMATSPAKRGVWRVATACLGATIRGGVGYRVAC